MASSSSISSSEFAISNIYPKLWFASVPEPLRFITAANLGTIAFFKIDKALYNLVILNLSKDMPKVFQRNRETVSFFFAYLIQVGLRHFLNAFLVYGLETIGTAEKYFQTLTLTYSSYSLSLVGSTFGNAILINRGVQKDVAFWGTIICFGVINFFLLKYFIGKSDEEEDIIEEGKKLKSSKRKKRIPAQETGQRKFTKVRGGQQQANRYFYEEGKLRERLRFIGIDPLLAFVQTTGNSVRISHIE